MSSLIPPSPPPLPAWVLALPPPRPPPPYNIPSRPIFPSRRQRVNHLQEQKKPRDSVVKKPAPTMKDLKQFRFLELPREIRVMVYKYLAPNTKPSEWCGKPQRHDGSCYPEILSVCRAIHDEVLDIFYSASVYFEIDISNNGIFFLGNRYLLSDLLPSTVRHAQSICARIQLEWRPVRQQEFKNRITEIFPPDSRLRNLQLYFQATSPAYIGRAATPDVVVSALDNTLSPLQGVAHNLGSKFHIDFETHIHQGRFSLGVDLNDVVGQYFDRFAWSARQM
ncbi:hypothetical protein ONS96_008309 [Cadophora gregata f. sp. sojae]|nr:hypothetical protein ONS96_008309 [Cadophora gregata f. sp. sojae]